MYGPIAAREIRAEGYGFNMNSQDTQCSSSNRLMRVGLMAEKAYVKGDIRGSVVSKSGKVEVTSQSDACYKSSAMGTQDFSDSLFSFAPQTLRLTSEKLAGFSPDTLIDRKSFALTSANSNRSFNGYRVIKFPACSDSDCVSAIPRKETSISVLKAGSNPQGQYQDVPSNEMIVLNIPVYTDTTFTITTHDVNRNISPCQIIYNFYPVDRKGNYVSDPNSTFTLVRPAGVTIAGTILAPQANIIDSDTGYFAGQLLTLQKYQGKGADIKDFAAASNGRCTSRSLCIPPEHISKVVTEVVTATAVSTNVLTTTVAPVANRLAIPDDVPVSVEDVMVTIEELSIVTEVETASSLAIETVVVDLNGKQISKVDTEKDAEPIATPLIKVVEQATVTEKVVKTVYATSEATKFDTVVVTQK